MFYAFVWWNRNVMRSFFSFLALYLVICVMKYLIWTAFFVCFCIISCFNCFCSSRPLKIWCSSFDFWVWPWPCFMWVLWVVLDRVYVINWACMWLRYICALSCKLWIVQSHDHKFLQGRRVNAKSLLGWRVDAKSIFGRRVNVKSL